MPAFKAFKPIYVYHNDTVKSAKKKTVSKYYSPSRLHTPPAVFSWRRP